MKCWNCGAQIKANPKDYYYAEGAPVCGYCAEDLAEKAGDTCDTCKKSDFQWSNERQDLICAQCERASER